MNLRIVLQCISTYIKLRVKKIKTRNMILSHRILIDCNADLNFYRTAKIVIKKNCIIRKNVLLSACDNASLTLGENVFINRNSIIVSKKSIVIGDNVIIGPNCCIYDHDHNVYNLSDYLKEDINIEEGTWIGAGCIILKGVHIGKNCVIAAGSIITKDIPSNTIYRLNIDSIIKQKLK